MRRCDNAGIIVLMPIVILLLAAFQKTPVKEIDSRQVLVRLDNRENNSLLKQFSRVKVVDSIPEKGIYLISVLEATTVERAISEFKSLPEISLAQPNYRYRLVEVNQEGNVIPDTENPTYLSGEEPLDYYGQPSADLLRTDSAGLLSDGNDIVVGIIDNGLDSVHILFEDALIDSAGYDYVDGDEFPWEEPGELLGHGTFVAGLVKLIAPECRIIPYRAFNQDGYGNCFSITQAIYDAIDDSVDVLNMSFRMFGIDTMIQQAVAAACQAGIVMVASSGNDSLQQITYPAAFDGVMAVSGLDTLQNRAVFSNFGAYIDVCAPGVNIYSSLAGQYQWGTWCGTSFASAQVSGICALILSLRPEFTPDEIDDHIKLTADVDSVWGTFTAPDPEYGYGYPDAFEAVLFLRRGDVDNSGTIDTQDIDYLSAYVNSGGPEPVPLYELGDVDCSGEINMFDITYLINYLQHGGPAPDCQY